LPSSLQNAGTQDNDASVGTIAWDLLSGDVFSSNDDYALATLSSGEQSQYLIAQTLGFAIPTGATILDIVARFARKVNIDGVDYPVIKDAAVKIIKGGTISGDNNADLASAWTTVDAVVSYAGGLWGLTWTAADINNSTFGVAMSVLPRRLRSSNPWSSLRMMRTLGFLGGFSAACSAASGASSRVVRRVKVCFIFRRPQARSGF
jgi:hypothetical protein